MNQIVKVVDGIKFTLTEESAAGAEQARVTLTDLAEALGYADKHGLKQLADRNRELVNEFGVVHTVSVTVPGRFGQVVEEPTYNPDQAAYLALSSETAVGRACRVRIIKAYKALLAEYAKLVMPKPMSALDLLEAQCRALRDIESRQLEQEKVQASHADQLATITDAVSELLTSDSERRELEENAIVELKQLPASSVCAPGKTLRALINECVRQYATRNGGGKSYREAWNKLYSELFYRCSFNAKVRAKNSGKDKLDEVENAGLLEQLYAIALDVLAAGAK